MHKLAKVVNSVVVETLLPGRDLTELFTQALGWFPCDDVVTQGWQYLDGSFLPPVRVQNTRIPASVTAFQARAALLQAGLLDAAEAAVTAAEKEVQLAWEYATEFNRYSPTLLSLAAALGLTPQRVDELFLKASQISA